MVQTAGKKLAPRSQPNVLLEAGQLENPLYLSFRFIKATQMDQCLSQTCPQFPFEMSIGLSTLRLQLFERFAAVVEVCDRFCECLPFSGHFSGSDCRFESSRPFTAPIKMIGDLSDYSILLCP